jgi:hypothetical protein
VVPLWAILRQRRWAMSVLKSFVLGMVASSLLAIYEFIARKRGLPWLSSYNASIGGMPRSASLSFEAAYFAAPTFAALVICWAAWPNGRRRTFQIIILVLGLIAANARITFVQLAIAALAYAVIRFRGSIEDRRLARRRLFSAIVLILCTMTLVVGVRPTVLTSIADRVQSIGDAKEETSNAPRLQAYAEISSIVKDHPLFGIAPGQLGRELESRGVITDAPGGEAASFVANNIWIQALLDGGLLAAMLQFALVVTAVFCLREARAPIQYSVLVAWMTIVGGAGLTVSNFWDSESWVLIGCFFALESTSRPLRATTVTARGSDSTRASGHSVLGSTSRPLHGDPATA